MKIQFCWCVWNLKTELSVCARNCLDAWMFNFAKKLLENMRNKRWLLLRCERKLNRIKILSLFYTISFLGLENAAGEMSVPLMSSESAHSPLLCQHSTDRLTANPSSKIVPPITHISTAPICVGFTAVFTKMAGKNALFFLSS